MGSPPQRSEEGSSRERTEAPSQGHHPSPARRALPMREEEKKQMEEAEKQVEEARRLEDVGRSLSSLPTQQLAQMAVEAGPSALCKEEPVRRKLKPTMGVKPPGRNSSRLERSKRPGSTGLAQLLFGRSSSSKRALSCSPGNSPSCGYSAR